jgi:hypothetical protein
VAASIAATGVLLERRSADGGEKLSVLVVAVDAAVRVLLEEEELSDQERVVTAGER